MSRNEIKLSSGRRGLPKGIGWGVVALAAIFLASVLFFFGKAREEASGRLAENFNRFQSGVADLKNLDTKAASEKFSETGKNALFAPGDLWGKISVFFGGAREVLLGFGDLASQGLSLAENSDFLLTNGLKLFLSGDGGELVAGFEKISAALETIGEKSAKISEAAGILGGGAAESVFAPEFYLPLSIDIARLQSFFSALIPWLNTEEPRRIVLMFQNSSELRPAGGFLGSYAVLTIKNGGLGRIDIHDIKDADDLLALRVIPPKPLQLAARDWGAAGANWFFDFPASAEKTLGFLEASELHSGDSTKFDGAVAVSPKVLGDILGLLGPTELKEAKITLDEDNFLITLQRQVELSREKRATYPKNVLRELVPNLFTRLSALDAEKAREFFALVGQWIRKRDLMFYFRNADFMSFGDFYEATGKVYELPKGFNGDYLAIVNANIGGGKTDLFMREAISLSSQINQDGTVANRLVIARKHEGNKAPYPFYKIPNQSYIQIFVPEGARLTNFKGGVEKRIPEPINYKARGYLEDSLVAEIEKTVEKSLSYPAIETHSESGRKVFSTWSRVNSGGKAEIVFDYVHRLVFAPADGVKYQFIFEKQAGTNRSYKFEISAPVGFRFRENGLPVFTYESSGPASPAGGSPERLILGLTLEEI